MGVRRVAIRGKIVAMAFRMTIKEPVLYVSWRGFTAEDLRAVIERVAQLRAETGAGVVYVSRVPADSRAFSAEERAALHEFLLALLPSCASLHHVIEGDGFVKSARRSIVTNMALATPRPRDFHTYATLEEALVAVGDTYGVDLSALAASSRPRAPPSATRVKSVPPTRRASSAFRAAVRIAGDRKGTTRRG
jgi:hypothetical protein